MDVVANILNGSGGETVTVQRTGNTIRCQFPRQSAANPFDTMAGGTSSSEPRMLTAVNLDVRRHDVIIRSDASQWKVEVDGVLRQVRNPITGKYISYMEYTVRNF
jgi:hypothetical protein